MNLLKKRQSVYNTPICRVSTPETHPFLIASSNTLVFLDTYLFLVAKFESFLPENGFFWFHISKTHLRGFPTLYFPPVFHHNFTISACIYTSIHLHKIHHCRIFFARPVRSPAGLPKFDTSIGPLYFAVASCHVPLLDAKIKGESCPLVVCLAQSATSPQSGPLWLNLANDGGGAIEFVFPKNEFGREDLESS